MAQTFQIEAEIRRITFRNGESGWTVAKAHIRGDPAETTITGAFAQINEGQHFQLLGYWANHPQFGRQFQIDRAVPMRPSDRKSILRYLSSGLIEGIGPKTAERIVDRFGKDTFKILDDNPRRLLEVPSIGRKKLKTIIHTWTKDRAANDTMIFLNTHGISPNYAQRILRLYQEQAVEIVSRDPYRLAQDIPGIGFKKADDIASALGIPADSAERIRAAALYYIQLSEEQGHCYLTSTQVFEQLTKLLAIDPSQLAPKLTDCLAELEHAGALFTDQSPDEERVYYRRATFIAESQIAQKAASLLASPMISDEQKTNCLIQEFCQKNAIELSEQQLEAVRQSVRSRVFILTGGPGVGKSTTANAIIQVLKGLGKSVALCAPTGRAAQRLNEITGLPARTIHRLLEWNPFTHQFNYNSEQPLTVQAVIADETSMLDVFLADSLLSAIPANAQLILIGDVDQLPSVGAGNVLRDLIDSHRIPVVRLEQVFRQAQTSHIIKSAHEINKGLSPEFDITSDCKFIEVDSPEQIKGVIKALVRDKLTADNKYDPVEDVQILSPMNRGELGTLALNDELQEILNPKSPGKTETKRGQLVLRPQDKVMQCVNNYDLGVFNGDIGFIDHCQVNGGKVIVRYADKLVTYQNEQISELKLAYAITIHKSQGSEFPVVIIPMSTQHFIMLQRNLVYTALTRAKKLAVFVGTRKALSYAIKNQTSMQRQTLLTTRLIHAIKA